MSHGGALFSIGAFDVTSTMVTGLAITVGLSAVAIISSRKLTTETPSGLQNCVEWAVGSLRNFYSGIMGPVKANKYVPLLGTLFMLILLSNYSGILPLAGKLPGFAAPSGTLSFTVGLSLIVFFATHGLGFRENGVGYLKHFISPIVIMLPFMIIEEVVRPLSLSLRLYGNIYAEETVTEQLFLLCPILIPVVMQGLSLLFGFIQAMVFTMLAAIYIDGATGHGH